MFILKANTSRLIGKEGIYDIISFNNIFDIRTPEDQTYTYKYILEIYNPSATSDFDVYSARFAITKWDISDFTNIGELVDETFNNPLYLYYANNVMPIGTNNTTFDPSNYVDLDAMIADYETNLGFQAIDITSVVSQDYQYLIVPIDDENLLATYKIVEYKYKDSSEELFVEGTTMMIKSSPDIEEEGSIVTELKEYDVYYKDENGYDVKVITRPPLLYDGKPYYLKDINYFFEGVQYDLGQLYDNYNSIDIQEIAAEDGVTDYNYNQLIAVINRFIYLKDLIAYG